MLITLCRLLSVDIWRFLYWNEGTGPAVPGILLSVRSIGVPFMMENKSNDTCIIVLSTNCYELSYFAILFVVRYHFFH